MMKYEHSVSQFGSKNSYFNDEQIITQDLVIYH